MPTIAPTAALGLGNTGVSIGSPVVWNPSGTALGNSSIKPAFRGNGTPRDCQSWSFTSDMVNAPGTPRTPTHEAMTAVESLSFTFPADAVVAPGHPRTPTPAHMLNNARDESPLGQF